MFCLNLAILASVNFDLSLAICILKQPLSSPVTIVLSRPERSTTLKDDFCQTSATKSEMCRRGPVRASASFMRPPLTVSCGRGRRRRHALMKSWIECQMNFQYSCNFRISSICGAKHISYGLPSNPSICSLAIRHNCSHQSHFDDNNLQNGNYSRPSYMPTYHKLTWA